MAGHRSPVTALRARVDAFPNAAEALASAAVQRRVEHGLNLIDNQKIEVLTFDDARYPDRLRNLTDAPHLLFALGRVGLLKRVCLAVVGSRRCTEYGSDTARALTTPAVRAGVVIVSGMALGIDSIAHNIALELGGDTIAVLGCGIDVCYPRSHRRLYQRIAEEGLLVTEFPPGMEPQPYHFPQRNRIIAFLASAVLVVEATADSGSLITAEIALPHMEVLAVPGPIGRPTSEGTNRLIATGGRIALSAADVLDALHIEAATTPSLEGQPLLNVDDDARRVWQELGTEGVHLDVLAERLAMPAATVAFSLLELELAGYARQLPGSRFSIVPAAV
jgi:DNA processing protein